MSTHRDDRTRSNFAKAYQLYRLGKHIYGLCFKMSGTFDDWSLEADLTMGDASDFEQRQKDNVASIYGPDLFQAAESAWTEFRRVDRLKRSISTRQHLYNIKENNH